MDGNLIDFGNRISGIIRKVTREYPQVSKGLSRSRRIENQNTMSNPEKKQNK